MTIQSRIRCAVCNAVRSFCHCPEDVPFSTSKDAGPCPDKVEDKAHGAAAKPTMRQKFERFCDDNPNHHDCRIYD